MGASSSRSQVTPVVVSSSTEEQLSNAIKEATSTDPKASLAIAEAKSELIARATSLESSAQEDHQRLQQALTAQELALQELG